MGNIINNHNHQELDNNNNKKKKNTTKKKGNMPTKNQLRMRAMEITACPYSQKGLPTLRVLRLDHRLVMKRIRSNEFIGVDIRVKFANTKHGVAEFLRSFILDFFSLSLSFLDVNHIVWTITHLKLFYCANKNSLENFLFLIFCFFLGATFGSLSRTKFQKRKKNISPLG